MVKTCFGYGSKLHTLLALNHTLNIHFVD